MEIKAFLGRAMKLETRILDKLKQEFSSSVDSRGRPDKLGRCTKGAVKRFILEKRQFVDETITLCEKDEACAKLIDLDFFRLPIGREFLKRKIFYDMMSNIEDEGLEYIQENTPFVLDAVDEMYEAYANDNELNDLRNPEGDWCREYLYEHIMDTDE